MTLHHPWLLLLLLIVPLLVWLRHGRRRRSAMRFGDTRSLALLPPGFGVVLQPVMPVLYGLGLVLLIIAIARPQKGLDESIVRTEAVDIVLCVDLSPSMRALDFSTPQKRVSRIDAVKQVVESFVEARKDDRIGIVGFAGLVYTIAPLTLEHGWLVQRLRQMDAGDLGQRTAVGDGLASAINRLRESKAKSKVIILLTDGASNAGRMEPRHAAQSAQALGIKVYTIGAGRPGMVPIATVTPWGQEQISQMPSDLDEDSLREIAKVTGAEFFRAQDEAGLRATYKQIDQMEKTEIEVQQYTRYEEIFQPWLWAAVGCLALERLLSLSRFGRLP